MPCFKEQKIIGVDGLPILGNLTQGTGITKYITYLMNEVFKNDNVNIYQIFLRMFKKDKKYLREIKEIFTKYENVMLKAFYLPDRIQQIVWDTKFLSDFVEQLYGKLDVYVSTCYFTPHFRKISIISFIYDISPLLFEEISKKHKEQFEQMLKKTISRSSFFFVISEYVKQCIIDRFNIDSKKIEILYPTIPDKFVPLPKHTVEPILNKYNLSRPYILYVGIRAKNKNVVSVVKAFNLLVKRHKDLPHKLVFVGRPYNLDIDKEIIEFCTLNKINERVVLMSYLPDEDIPAIYSAADVFVFASFYEGFGMPVLEAISCGVPVAVSNSSSLPEVVGDAGLYFDPYNIEEIYETIYRIIIDNNLRDLLIAKGIKRTEFFRNYGSAEKFIKVITTKL